ncbi:SURF1 family protein [Dinoroseobacter sp. S375]|uniref:SURF1 family protein n=1 Tax=Dinoroseobacter sp. S375 TaxID=3415136 RepID=UPI003C79AA37
MRRMAIPLAFGVIGTLILLALGNWQVNRLAEKEAFLAEIDARIADLPVELPASPDPEADRFLAVELRGTYTGEEIDVLASAKGIGAAYRVISVFETEEGRRVLVDRGFLPVARRDTLRDFPEARLQGNLHWPDEVDGFTPEPDAASNTWFAREVPALAATLNTEPVLLILRATSEPAPFATPYPLDSSGIPNDHLEYAVTWFSLAAVWFGMTLYFLWRMRRSERRNDSPEAE